MTIASDDAMRKLCRCCGKPLPPLTVRVTFEPQATQYHHPMSYWRYAYFGVDGKRPQTIDDAKRYINDGAIVAVKRDETGIRHVSVWDGTSYKSKYFCTNSCAVSFAYAFAENGGQCKAHEQAMKKRLAKPTAA